MTHSWFWCSLFRSFASFYLSMCFFFYNFLHVLEWLRDAVCRFHIEMYRMELLKHDAVPLKWLAECHLIFDSNWNCHEYTHIHRNLYARNMKREIRFSFTLHVTKAEKPSNSHAILLCFFFAHVLNLVSIVATDTRSRFHNCSPALANG